MSIFRFTPAATRPYLNETISQQPIKIAKVTVHPKYEYPFSYFDLALLELAESTE